MVETSAENRDKVNSLISSGRLIRAEVFVALKLRRAVMSTFMVALVTKYEEEIAEKPSPMYLALLKAEIMQMKMYMQAQMNGKVKGEGGGAEGDETREGEIEAL